MEDITSEDTSSTNNKNDENIDEINIDINNLDKYLILTKCCMLNNNYNNINI